MAGSHVSDTTSTQRTDSIKSQAKPKCSPKRCCQIVTGAVLFLLITGCLIINRLSVTWILVIKDTKKDQLLTWYAAMGLILIVPEAVALVKVFWHTSFIKRTTHHKWPGPRTLVVGSLVSFAEASSYVVFSLEVAPLLPIQLLLPLMSSVFAISLSHQQWQCYKAEMEHKRMPKLDTNFTLTEKVQSKSEDSNVVGEELSHVTNNWKRVLQTLISFSGVWCSCAVAGIVALTSSLPWFQAICLPASLSLLALCWHQQVQVYIVKSADGTFSGRWKATCVYTIIKVLVLIIGLNIVMLLRLKQHGILDTEFFISLWSGVMACRQPHVLYPLLCHFASSLAVHVLGYVGAGLCLAGVTISLPFILATPASIGILLFSCSPYGIPPFTSMPCLQVSIPIWCACALALITWLAPILIRGRHVNRSSDMLLVPYHELFIQPTWNGLFLDQHLSLNYKHDGFNRASYSVDDKESCTRVFICTTMYRETDVEMGRLLSSIFKVSKSQKLSKIYLETHIFMDNGTQDMHITDFGSQLVSLLESKLGVTAKDASAHTTPYGVQLNWVLPGGMPFFIHLKDSNKVKPKKRWSQIMYMSYVLNYRVIKYNKQEEMKLNRHISDISTMDESIFLGYASEREWKKNFTTLDTETITKISPNFARVNSALDSKTRRYLRESKRKIAEMAKESDYTISFHKVDSSETTSSSVPTSSLESTAHTSSDTGLGTSDDVVSLTSSAGKNDDEESSDATASRQSSLKHDSEETWKDYEGDVSSNNENSLTSNHARFFSERTRDYFYRKGEVMYENLPHPMHQDKSGYYMTPYQSSQYYPFFNKSLERRQRRATPNHPVKPPRANRHKREHSNVNITKLPLIRTNVATDTTGKCVNNTLYENSTPGVPFHRNRTTEESMGLGQFSYVNPSFTGPLFPESTYPKTHMDESCKSVELLEPEHSQISIPDSPDGTVIPLKKSSAASDFLKLSSDDSPIDDHTYILATDADMEFSDDSVVDLLNLCHYDRRVGGACGRTHPIGQKTGPLVWYQKFEYAKDFWMIKSAQNVIGSVMCCPGCFSLYRAGAVRDVVANYASPTSSSFDVFIKDTGEDRWMCTLMMLQGWKLEYTAFCDNTTFCPDSFNEFMKQRRRWVLSDIANMILVFRNVFRLTQNNNSFSIAYILYLAQMFSIVLLSPASTVVIIAGGLDIVYGVPYALVAPVLGVIILTYALVCLVGSMRVQERLSLALTMFLGLVMLLVVIGGAVFVVQDITTDIQEDTLTFQEYYLILLLIAALIFAAFVHPTETWILTHGLSYLLGFPAMQILLPIYSICNIVDQSWGTREKNESTSPPVSCFSKNRKKYHKSLSRKSQIEPEETKEENVAMQLDEEREQETVTKQPSDDEKPITCPTGNFRSMTDETHSEEFPFWTKLRDIVIGHDVNLGLRGDKLNTGLRRLRNLCLICLLLLNTLWLVLLSLLYYNTDMNLAKLNIYGLIAGAVYGLVLFIQLVGMTVHRIQALFARFGRAVFGDCKPVWIYRRDRNS